MMALRGTPPADAAQPVIEVGPDHVARVVTQTERVARALQSVRDAAAVPFECGTDIPVAPARGPMLTFTPREVVRTKSGGSYIRNSGYLGRKGARVADAFDVMTLQAQRQHPRVISAAQVAHTKQAVIARAAGRKPRDFVEPAFVPPFTAGQVQTARSYAALSERVAASGVKCSTLDAVHGGGGGDREVAMLRDFDALRVMHRRIGNGLAKEIRRIRPNGIKRQAIYVRRLVDMVCLGGMALDGVLKAHGWALDQKSRDGLRKALCAALERMQGYDLARDKKGVDA